jgi:hypothetical protein
MTGKTNKFARAIDQRQNPTPDTSAPLGKATTMTTVEMSRHLRAQLDTLFAQLYATSGRRVKIGPASVALYELLIESPDLQQEVIKRLT